MVWLIAFSICISFVSKPVHFIVLLIGLTVSLSLVQIFGYRYELPCVNRSHITVHSRKNYLSR